MKRDMDLVRKILLEIEGKPYAGGWVKVELPEHTKEEVMYHLILLAEAGLIRAESLRTIDGVQWRPTRLTWAGHEFLEAARDQGRWEKAKAEMKDKVGGVIFSVLKELLVELAKGLVLPGR